MKKYTSFLATLLSAVILLGSVLCIAGCSNSQGGPGDIPDGVEADRTVVYYAAANVTAQVKDYYQELVDTYNTTQGVIDKVYVQMRANPGAINGLDSALRSNYMYDVIQLSDDQYKAIAMQGKNYFVTLDSYLTDEAKATMNWDDIPANLINRFRLNTTLDPNGLFLDGEGADLLALPNGSAPHVLYYNKAILEAAGINIVSVAEAQLDAYNSQNNASLMPHGYAEYKNAPFTDPISSPNEAAE